MLDAERIAAHYEHRWRNEASESRYHDKLEELKAKKAEYLSLPLLEQRKLAEMRKVSKERQLDRYLDYYRTADARIDGIGPDHKITLQAYGFETAADIKRDAMMRVPGFSGTLGQRMIGWRKSLEEKFVFNPTQALTPADKYAVDQELHSIRLKLEQELANGATHLRHAVQEIQAARETLREKVEETRRALRQAEEDLRAATRTNPSSVVILSMLITLAILLLFRYLL
jgi:DNA-binding helix-hairpin-helix protein with protein kinase domain